MTEPGTSHISQAYVRHPWVGWHEYGEEYPVNVLDHRMRQKIDFRDEGSRGAPAESAFGRRQRAPPTLFSTGSDELLQLLLAFLFHLHSKYPFAANHH